MRASFEPDIPLLASLPRRNPKEWMTFLLVVDGHVSLKAKTQRLAIRRTSFYTTPKLKLLPG